jgi:hypothetical protein
MKARRGVFGGVLGILIGLSLLAGCERKDDAISKAEKKDVTKGIAAPGIAATKAIAEEGFIYGLPLLAQGHAAFDLAAR